MRKVRDYDAELRALATRPGAQGSKKVQQLGELVTSTGADALDLDTLAGALLAAVPKRQRGRKGGVARERARPSFSDAGARLAGDARRPPGRGEAGQALRRVEAAARRTDTRGWVVQRRERTRHLIELGGLVQKAGLVDLADDDRATLYGAMLDCAPAPEAMMPATCWRSGSGAGQGARSTLFRSGASRADVGADRRCAPG
jgi:hypothetical protein